MLTGSPMDSREFGGLELAARARIVRQGSFWLVPSASHQGSHRVSYEAAECSCEDFELHGKPCKHIHAVRIVREREKLPIVMQPPLVADPVEKPKRKTYPQKWSAYNAAQTNEKRQFLELLSDLCSTVVEPERKTGPGRKPVPLRDGIFSAAYKVYSGFSGRRFTTDLLAACDAGYVASAPHYNSVFRVFEDADTTAVLRKLIEDSSKPLAGVESAFAVDSTGIGSSRFVKWFDTKYGVERKHADWVKLHVCVGVKTNVVTAVEIGDGHDTTMFPPLVNSTAERFTIKEMTADKAYSSNANRELCNQHKAEPYIPFRALEQGKEAGDTWRRMFHLFQFHRDEFCARYHQRSNVESTFSAIKRVFGDSVRSKTTTAMTNEVLAKILCHNLVVLIHEMHELGIDPSLGKRDAIQDDGPQVLKFPA